MNSIKFYLSGTAIVIKIAAVTYLIYLIFGDGLFGIELDETVSYDSGIAILYSILIVIGSFIFYLIFTRLKESRIRLLYAIVLTLPYIILSYESFYLAYFLSTPIIFIILGLFLGGFGLYFFIVFGDGLPKFDVRNWGIIIAGVITGRQIALYFDLTAIVVFAIILSVFDIYSVFYGPLSKIIGKPIRKPKSFDLIMTDKMIERGFVAICKKGTPVIFTMQNTILGVGDVLFYSILLYQALLSWGLIGFILTFSGILIGSLLTMYLLTYISPLPALPLPVFIALVAYHFTGLYF